MATLTDPAIGAPATGRWSWWFPPVALGRVAALRVIAYLFVPIDVVVTNPWVADHGDVPSRLFRPVLLARLVHLPTPTHDGVAVLRIALLAATVAALVLGLRAAGRSARLAGVLVAVLYLWWMLVAQSYGKVDHDRFAFVLMLFVLPTVGVARLGDRTPSEAAGWAVKTTQIGVVATYTLAAWAKIRFGGWGWVNGATLTRAVLRRGTWLARWTLDAPWFLHGFQWFLVAFELGAVVLLFLRSRRLVLLIVGLLFAFHVTTFLMIGIIFLPHLVALTSFLPLEELYPMNSPITGWARRRRWSNPAS